MPRPVKTFKAGVIRVAIFENAGGRYTALASKAFKRDGAENWEYTNSFGVAELPCVIALQQKAWEWMIEPGAQLPPARSQSSQSSPPKTTKQFVGSDDKDEWNYGETKRGEAAAAEAEDDIPF